MIEDEDDFGESRIEAANEARERAGEHADNLTAEDVDAREFGKLINLIGSQNTVIEEAELNGGELVIFGEFDDDFDRSDGILIGIQGCGGP